VREQPLGREPTHLARADDKRRANGLAVAVGLDAGPVERDSAGGDVGGRERPDADRLGREIGRRRDELAQREHNHSCERHRDHDAAQIFEQLVVEPRCVEAPQRRDGERNRREDGDPEDGRRRDAGRART
jgi:hypothetical protein